jgi:putative flippase GtrA
MQQFFRFITVGVVNTALSYCVILGCMYFAKISPELSNISGYIFGVVISYCLHRKFTFDSSQQRVREIGRFLLVFGMSYGFNFVVLIFLIHKVEVDKGVSQIISGMAYVAVSFVMNKFYVFRDAKADENE